MTGAIINSCGIILGGAAALVAKKNFDARRQHYFKVILGAATVWLGLSLTWKSLSGRNLGQALKELLIVLLAMSLGRLLGSLLRLQKLSNAIGQFAGRILAAPKNEPPFRDGFLLGMALFCAAPLAILASVQEGLDDLSMVFVVKALIDGLTAMAFVLTFGGSVMAAALPVLAWEGALIYGVRLLEPALRSQPWPLIDAINATDGLLIFSVALIIFEMRKIAVADYLPSLALAPLLTWLFK